MKTYNQLLHSYRQEAEVAGISLTTIRQFLFELCTERNIDLFRQLDQEVDSSLQEKFVEGVQRLLRQEPLAYVLGYRWFYGYRYRVNKDVLIPRDETAELVALILACIDEDYPQGEIKVVDVGCGSGAIALSLAQEEKRVHVSLSDISPAALAIAKENAEQYGVRADFYCGDMLCPLQESGKKWNILVSNPPYIPEEEVLDISVKDYEPHIALFGGQDGLHFYRILLREARSILEEHGHIFFEIAWNQKTKLVELARSYFPDAEIEVRKDINGKDRMFSLKF